MNHVTISGNLTKDPQMMSTQGGTGILKFSVAVSDRKRNPQTGQWEDVAHFVDCVMFGKRTEPLSKMLKKGQRVYVDGKLSYSSWEKDGQKRSKIEVIANDVELPPRQQGGSYGQQGQQQGNYYGQAQNANQGGSQGFSGGGYDQYDSDIPW